MVIKVLNSEQYKWVNIKFLNEIYIWVTRYKSLIQTNNI